MPSPTKGTSTSAYEHDVYIVMLPLSAQPSLTGSVKRCSKDMRK